MKIDKKLYPIYLLLGFLFICSSIVWYYYDSEYFNLIVLLAFFLAIGSFFRYRRMRIKINDLETARFWIQTYNFHALFNLFFLGPYFIYQEFYNKEKSLTIVSVGVMFLLLSITILQFIVDLKSYHYIDKSGIHEANGELMIDASKIEEIEYHKREIVFHTRNKRNDLMIKRYRVASPDWEELVERIKLLNYLKEDFENG